MSNAKKLFEQFKLLTADEQGEFARLAFADENNPIGDIGTKALWMRQRYEYLSQMFRDACTTLAEMATKGKQGFLDLEAKQKSAFVFLGEQFLNTKVKPRFADRDAMIVSLRDEEELPFGEIARRIRENPEWSAAQNGKKLTQTAVKRAYGRAKQHATASLYTAVSQIIAELTERS